MSHKPPPGRPPTYAEVGRTYEKLAKTEKAAALEDLKKRLLSDEVVHAAWEAVLEGIQPEDVLPELRGEARTREILEAAIKAAEESE